METMSKKNYLLVGFLVFAVNTSLLSQTVTSSKGGSAILYQGTGLGFDLTDETIKFNINNYSQSSSAHIKRAKGMLLGAEVSAANSNSTGFLFNGGDFQPTSKLGGTLGVYWSNREELIDEYQRVNKKLYQLLEFRKNRSILIDSIIQIRTVGELDLFFTQGELVNYSGKDKAEWLKAYQDQINSFLTSQEVDDEGIPIISYAQAFAKYENDIAADKKMPAEKKAFILLLLEKMKQLIADDMKLLESTEEEIEEAFQNIKARTFGQYWKTTLFTVGGINAEKFKRFTSLDTTNFNGSFKNEFGRGSYFGVGLNINLPFQGELILFKNKKKKPNPKFKTKTCYLLRNVILGAKYTYNETSNFGLLDKQTYKLVQNYTNSSGQVLTSTKDITAYSGSYTKLYENRLNLDLMKVFNLDSLSIVADLYAVNKKVNRTDLIPETTDVGISFSFFKPEGKFMGGFYVEVPDWDDNLEDIKETPNYRKRINRMTFGIYATYTFGSLFNSTLFAPK